MVFSARAWDASSGTGILTILGSGGGSGTLAGAGGGVTVWGGAGVGAGFGGSGAVGRVVGAGLCGLVAGVAWAAPCWASGSPAAGCGCAPPVSVSCAGGWRRGGWGLAGGNRVICVI